MNSVNNVYFIIENNATFFPGYKPTSYKPFNQRTFIVQNWTANIYWPTMLAKNVILINIIYENEFSETPGSCI